MTNFDFNKFLETLKEEQKAAVLSCKTEDELEKVIESSEAAFTDNLRLAFVVYVCAEKLRGSDKISDAEIRLAEKLYKELGSSVREKNEADLYKLEGILEQSEKDLGIMGKTDRKPFPW